MTPDAASRRDRPRADLAATLLLIRHGESIANAERRFTGHDDEPLTEIGREQARATGRRLRATHASGFGHAGAAERAIALYASPYSRALETAREIGSFLDLEPSVVTELREQSFGGMAGRPYLELYPALAQLPAVELWDARAPGGESLREVAARAAPAIDRIARRHRGEQVVVVSHGGVMAALRAHATGNFAVPPESTVNAWGYRLVGSPEHGYSEPLALIDEPGELSAAESAAAAPRTVEAVAGPLAGGPRTNGPRT